MIVVRRCRNCGAVPGRHRGDHGRCNACASYWRAHAAERPRDLWTREPPRRQQRAYELRMAGVAWADIAARLGFSGVCAAQHAAGKHRRRHGLPWLRTRPRGDRGTWDGRGARQAVLEDLRRDA